MQRYLLLLIISCISTSLVGQELIDKINPGLIKERWEAQWIQHPTESATDYGVFHFRKSFDLREVPKEFIINVSADNRYRLYVNGEEVGFGPARGDYLHWYFETYDISKNLREGKNVIAALVWNMGDQKPLAQMSYQTAFILQGNSDKESAVNTNSTWRVIKSKAYRPIEVDFTMARGYYAAGGMDRVDGALYPWGWTEVEYKDSNWLESGNIGYGGQGAPYGYDRYTATSAWQLIPRDIPMMETRVERITEIVRTNQKSIDNAFLKGEGELVVKPNQQTNLLLDLRYLTTAFPTLITEGGRDSEIRITYAEALYGEDWKGNRNKIDGKEIIGLYDQFFPGGGSNESFKSLWTRTFRYVELEITTKEEPLTISDFYGTYSAYPFKENAVFNTDNPVLSQIWDVGWRTARLCAMETYMDCPYYEQLQYIGDTRIQALISLYVSGDDRLMKKAIRQFDQSRFFEGLTMSRHPTSIPQVSPPYSLIQVLMVHDFMMYKGDREFIREMMPGVETILGWFERKVDSTGLTGMLNWVNYMDAAEGFKSGTPPYQHEGHSAQISLLYAYAAKHAAELFEYIGDHQKHKKYMNDYQSLVGQVYGQCYDEKKRLFAETPARQYFTQHTNILAILTDAISVEEQPLLMEKILDDPSLTKVEIYFQFYLFEALRKTGMADKYVGLLDDWYIMLDKGLTTFAEHRDNARSDCHAWSAHPMHGFLATVSGIRSTAPGFKTIEIAPSFGDLSTMKSSIPHPLGEIKLNLSRNDDKVKGTIDIPPQTEAVFKWNGKELTLSAGVQTIHAK